MFPKKNSPENPKTAAKTGKPGSPLEQESPTPVDSNLLAEI